MKKKIVSGMILTLLIGMLTLALNIQPAKASGTIFIRADGSVEPEGTPISSIDNITYTFTDNIYDEIVVERDNIVVDGAGYTLQGTESGTGITLSGRRNVTIRNTRIAQFACGVYFWNTIDSNIENITATNSEIGIRLDRSSDNNVLSNTVVNCGYAGMLISFSSGNTISGNTMRGNSHGVFIHYCSDNTVSGNTVTGNWAGILLQVSSGNTISGNIVSGNDPGIWLWFSSSNNTVSENNSTQNDWGILLDSSNDNKFCHNNVINNGRQVEVRESQNNVWDDSYPSGGNYWSDHVMVDDYSGINQNETGSDGIVDTPYIIDGNNQDNYPLMNPWTPVITATIDIDPDTLNLRSQGEWVTAYIELPEGYNVSDISVSSIRLNETFSVDPDAPIEIGDYDSDGVSDLMVKFDRTELTSYIYSVLGIKLGNVTLTVSGELNDGTVFEGTDTIRVIFVGDINRDGKVNIIDLSMIGKRYGTTLEEPLYHERVDLNSDGNVDIIDLAYTAINYGATTPE